MRDFEPKVIDPILELHKKIMLYESLMEQNKKLPKCKARDNLANAICLFLNESNTSLKSVSDLSSIKSSIVKDLRNITDTLTNLIQAPGDVCIDDIYNIYEELNQLLGTLSNINTN